MSVELKASQNVVLVLIILCKYSKQAGALNRAKFTSFPNFASDSTAIVRGEKWKKEQEIDIQLFNFVNKINRRNKFEQENDKNELILKEEILVEEKKTAINAVLANMGTLGTEESMFSEDA